MIGVGIALGERLALPEATQGAWLGVAAVFASALCGAICSVFYRPRLCENVVAAMILLVDSRGG
jgi:hypothetical protein